MTGNCDTCYHSFRTNWLYYCIHIILNKSSTVKWVWLISIFSFLYKKSKFTVALYLALQKALDYSMKSQHSFYASVVALAEADIKCRLSFAVRTQWKLFHAGFQMNKDRCTCNMMYSVNVSLTCLIEPVFWFWFFDLCSWFIVVDWILLYLFTCDSLSWYTINLWLGCVLWQQQTQLYGYTFIS